MNISNQRLSKAIYIFIFIILLLYILKPNCLFEEQKRRVPRQFGIGFTRSYEKKTIFNFTTLIVITAILSYFCFR